MEKKVSNLEMKLLLRDYRIALLEAKVKRLTRYGKYCAMKW